MPIPVHHRILLAASVIAILAIAAIYRASPGPADQEIIGIALGAGDGGPVLISGRRLGCTAGSPRYGADGAVCNMELAGRPLEIHAMRNQAPDLDLLGGRCEAIYDGNAHPCRFGNPNVSAHFYAYLPDALGLTSVDIAALRSRHWIENLGEDVWVLGLGVVPMATSVVAGGLTAAWTARRVRRRLVAGLAGLVAAVAAFAIAGTGWLALTARMWD